MRMLNPLIRKYNSRKISTQYLLLLIPAILLLFLAFGFVAYTLGKPEALKTNYELAEVVTKKTNQALMRWLEEQIRTAQTIARDPRIMAVTLSPADPQKRADAQKFLSEMHARYPYYENIPLAAKLAPDRTIAVDVFRGKSNHRQWKFLHRYGGRQNDREVRARIQLYQECLRGKALTHQ